MNVRKFAEPEGLSPGSPRGKEAIGEGGCASDGPLPTPGRRLDKAIRNVASSPTTPDRRFPPGLRARIRLVGGEAGEALGKAQGRALRQALAALGLAGPEATDKEE